MSKVFDKENGVVAAVLGLFDGSNLNQISISDVAELAGTSSIALRLRYGSSENMIQHVAKVCFDTVFEPLEAAIDSGLSTEQCWYAFRESVMDHSDMVLLYESFRESFGIGFEGMANCRNCASRLFPDSSDLHFLWSHFIFDAKKSALKVLRMMKDSGVSSDEAMHSIPAPDLSSTAMRAHVIGFNQLCSAM